VSFFSSWGIAHLSCVLADAYVHELGEKRAAGRGPDCVHRAPLGTRARISQGVLRVRRGAAPLRTSSTRRTYLARGSGRSWNLITLLVVPFPVSMWNGARVLMVDHTPRPFHPPFASSIRPSIHFV